MRIKITYEGQMNAEIDVKICKAMKSIGAKWYAQGTDLTETPYIRDICFDLEEKE